MIGESGGYALSDLVLVHTTLRVLRILLEDVIAAVRRFDDFHVIRNSVGSTIMIVVQATRICINSQEANVGS